MVRVHLVCVAIFLLAVVVNSPSLMAGPEPLPTEGMLDDLDLADAVFVGKIVKIEPVQPLPGRNHALTFGLATVAVSETLKGHVEKELKIKVVTAVDPDGSAMAHTPRVDHEGDGGIWGIRGSEAFEKYGSGDKADIDKVKRMLRLLERRTWSAPVQGVAVWGFLPADPFGRDSRAIIFAARNVTTDTIYIPDAEYKGVVDVVLKDSKGKEYRTDRRYSRKPEKTIFCGALESHAVVYMHPAKSLYSLPADLPDGEYTLTVVLANDRDLGVIRKSGRMKSGEWDAVKPWQGKVTTPPIKFTVKDGKAIPAKELLDSEDARQQSN